METKDEFNAKLETLLADGRKMIEEAQAYLISKGEVVDLASWVTIKKYCELFDIKNQETVMNWINRGIVPAENIRVVEEFNNTRLIKAVPYQVRTKKTV